MPTRNKTITLKVRFFTTARRTALRRGVVEMEANTFHDIRHVGGGGKDLFNSMDQLVKAVLGVARRAGVRIISDAKTRSRARNRSRRTLHKHTL